MWGNVLGGWPEAMRVGKRKTVGALTTRRNICASCGTPACMSCFRAVIFERT